MNIFVVVLMLLGFDADHVAATTCSVVGDFSCTEVMRGGDVIQQVLKRLPPSHVVSSLPQLSDKHHRACVDPACLSGPCLNGGACEETLDGFQCDCTINFIGLLCQGVRPKDCDQMGNTQASGVYQILISGFDTLIDVYCDADTAEGAWLVIHRRRFPSGYSFYRTWTEYKAGFGDLSDEFWLGNDIIHAITHQNTYQLRIDFEYSTGDTYATYTSFQVASETDKYRMIVSGHAGNEPDHMLRFTDSLFSTKDQDNEGCYYDCANDLQGGWWYYECMDHAPVDMNNGNYWIGLPNLVSAEMKIKPINVP